MSDFLVPLAAALVAAIIAPILSQLFGRALGNIRRESLTSALGSLHRISGSAADFLVDLGMALFAVIATAGGMIAVAGLIAGGEFSNALLIAIGAGAFLGGALIALNSAREAGRRPATTTSTGIIGRIAYTGAIILSIGIVIGIVVLVVIALSDENGEPMNGDPTPTPTFTATHTPTSTATATSTRTPTPTTIPTPECDEIRGKPYRDDQERDFFRSNCITPTDTSGPIVIRTPIVTSDGQCTPEGRISLEGEFGAGEGQMMEREMASGARTVLLLTGQSRTLSFDLITGAQYCLNVRYSNDNANDLSLELVAVRLDGSLLGQFFAQDTGDGGFGWNVFVWSDIVGVANLSPGHHQVVLSVTGGDEFGIEIDVVALVLLQ